MIAFLEGKLVHKEPTFIVINVNGVGYHVNISLNTFSEIKDQENVKLATYLQVREDAHILFGFSNAREKAMFQSPKHFLHPLQVIMHSSICLDKENSIFVSTR